MDYVAIILLIGTAAFGVQALFIFAARNGLLAQFDHCREKHLSPDGKPLQQLNTNGRIPALDWQIRAPSIFQLIFCEDVKRPDTNLVGLSFVCAAGSSWALVILESLRAYNESRWLSWIAIPGVLVYNHGHAVCTPLYLAYRLAFTSVETAVDLGARPIDLEILPWSLALGYVLPLILMALPNTSAQFKHTTAGWYQQWNLWISAVHYVLLWLWSDPTSTTSRAISEVWPLLNNAYAFIFCMAAVGHWVPIIYLLFVKLRAKDFAPGSFRSVFVPPSPFKARRSEVMADGGKWLLQWDILVGTIATAIWAGSLYVAAAGDGVSTSEAIVPFSLKLLQYLVLGGPMGVPIGLIWERDMLVRDIR